MASPHDRLHDSPSDSLSDSPSSPLTDPGPDPLYERLRATRPELFGNAPGGIDILLDPAEVEEARRAVGGAAG
ncbi:hypothetical protein ACSNOH_12365, partial [Streptomyces sp. URMC 127]